MMFCLVEMLKNGFDWGASAIRLLTQDRDRFHFVDNGSGMNEANRRAFVSVGQSTAHGRDQSGIFGSGSKYLLFSFASYASILTAPEDDPDHVYLFHFTPDELAKMYCGTGEIKGERKIKTPESWPHEHPFGTELTISFAEPGFSGILRGERLAKRLAERLDLVMAPAVTVDDQPLPSKRIKGQIYRYELPEGAVPGLGPVRLEFWHPDGVIGDQRLLMTGRNFGEVDFRGAFLDVLRDDQRELVPALFLDRRVCGLIAARYLNDHVMENRIIFSIGVADDERTTKLLEILRQVEADVANRLEIPLRPAGTAVSRGEDEIQAVIKHLNQLYDLPPTVYDPPIGPVAPPGPSIRVQREQFELGEEIVARLVVPVGSTEGFTFSTSEAHATLISQEGPTLTLKASELGHGLLQATNFKTGQRAEGRYEVVGIRYFQLSASRLTVYLGGTVSVHARNEDRLKGPIDWELEGQGELEISRRIPQVKFTPKAVGRATILASDSGNPAIQHRCEIHVLPPVPGDQLIKIREETFRREPLSSYKPEHAKPVRIIAPKGKGQGAIHVMWFNPQAPGYQESLRRGTLPDFLFQAMAWEYTLSLEQAPPEELSGEDYKALADETQRLAYQLYAEMVGGGK